MRDRYDAVVVGAGPNGLAAAVEIARAGRSVLVVERGDAIGGGCRTDELTLPGFRHDVCSAVHPFGVASPYLRTLPLDRHGLEWVQPDAPIAHPLDDGTAVVVERSIDETASRLGADADAYRRLVGPRLENLDELLADVLRPPRIPHHPIVTGRFALSGARSTSGLLRSRFSTDPARAVVAGLAAHAELDLDRFPHAVPATLLSLLFLAVAHGYGFPVARGGSHAIVDALADHLRSLGGEIRCGVDVATLADVPDADAVLFDTSAPALARIAGDALPSRYRRTLERFRHGPGVFKIDWALDAAVPWKAEECLRSATVHLGGTLEEIAAAESAVLRGEHPERPYVLIGQQSLFDQTRAPEGRHTLWGYCHVPNGSDVDMTDAIEAQIERFAPGFGDRVLARHTRTAVEVEAYNPNYVGGDIASGWADIRGFFVRPVLSRTPHATPNERLFLCSSATPPGPGVHGLCGFFAARTALDRVLR